MLIILVEITVCSGPRNLVLALVVLTLHSVSPGVKYRAVAQSSYFLDHANTDGDYVYGEQMRNVFFLQNSTSGVDQDCIADTTPEQRQVPSLS